MRKNQASITASGIAMLRAIESEKPEGERLIYDPYARLFVSHGLFFIGKFFTQIGYAERRGPGVLGFLVARERYIDDFLLDTIQNGAAQVVILGAGFDARAYRFREALAGVTVIEVDHPATQAIKLERLRKLTDPTPENVVFASVDFDTQSLEERLLDNGYNPQRKTSFIWQGVTYYLTQAGVERTLSFVREHSAPGSTIIFDYIDAAVLQHAGRHGEVSNLRRYRHLTGENLHFGIPLSQVETFLQQRGFRHVHNVTSEDLRRLYFSDKPRTVAEGYGIVSAEVDALN